jgi:hypothetical protein
MLAGSSNGELSMSTTETKWLIEAPEDILVEALQFVGLDPNALRSLVGPDADAALVYPSFFCDLPEEWMATLAYLAQRNIAFRIYLIDTDIDNRGLETARARVYPRFDKDMLGLLESISTQDTMTLDAYAHRVEKALNKMRQHAEKVEPNLTSEWI